MPKKMNKTKTTFLSIDRNGIFFTRSDKDNPNSVEVKNKEGQVSYRELFDGGTIDGYISGLTIKDVKFSDGTVRYLYIAVTNGLETDLVQLQLFYNGKMNVYVKNLTSVLPNLDFSKQVNLVPSTSKNNSNYVNRSIYINYVNPDDDVNFVPLAHYYGDDGDIPNPVKTEKLGEEYWDFQEQDEYMYNILNEEIKRFNEYRKTTEYSMNIESLKNSLENQNVDMNKYSNNNENVAKSDDSVNNKESDDTETKNTTNKDYNKETNKKLVSKEDMKEAMVLESSSSDSINFEDDLPF